MEKLCKIRDIQRSIMQFETNFQKKYEICLNEGMLLCSLSKTKQLSSGEIGNLLGLTLSNGSKVIKSVENKQYIERAMGTSDKRQMHFSLTPKGREFISKIKCEEVEIPPYLEIALKNHE